MNWPIIMHINYCEQGQTKILKQSGYSGFICIESPRKGDREWYAKQDIFYIKQLLEEISE